MAAPKCPGCGIDLPMFRPKHQQDKAARKVVAKAAEAAPIGILANVYASAAGCSIASARRAVERLAERRILERLESGWYRAVTKK